SVAEAALLVAMVRGPALYDPRRHPERALERRNLVLRETKEQGSITLEQYATARASALAISPRPTMGTSPYPAFVELVYRQRRRRTTTTNSTAWCRCASRSRSRTTPRPRAWAPLSASRKRSTR